MEFSRDFLRISACAVRIGRRTLIGCLWLLASVATLPAQTPASDTGSSPVTRIEPVVARHGMVVAQEARAARIGVDVLQKGGNAVDAAVAVGFALAVTFPKAGNIGGGGYMVIHLAERNLDVAID